MQVGKKIYYEKSSGNVILEIEEVQGSAAETTIEEDFASFVALSQRVPSTVGCLQLNFGDLSTEFAACSGYRVDITSNTIVFEYTPPATPPPTVSLEARIKALEDVQLANMLA